MALCATALGLATIAGTGITAGRPFFEKAFTRYLDWKFKGKLKVRIYNLCPGGVMGRGPTAADVQRGQEIYDSMKRELACREPWSIDYHKGQLLVTASDGQHRRISEFLRSMRENE